MNDRTSVTSAVPIDTTPQPIRMRAIQRRAPTRSRIRLLGNLEQAVGEEEQPGRRTRTRRAQVQVALELGRREPDVDPVDVGDDVAQERERDQPAPHPAQDVRRSEPPRRDDGAAPGRRWTRRSGTSASSADADGIRGPRSMPRSAAPRAESPTGSAGSSWC